MDSQLISQGLDLMLYGMGTVFIFLTVLVAITTIMSATVNKITPEQIEDAEIKAPQTQVETRIVKAIQAAINQHRGV
jgi:oxaloacetate decarboxylase gamma subunit